MDNEKENRISIDDFLSPLYELAEEIDKESEKNKKEEEHPE